MYYINKYTPCITDVNKCTLPHMLIVASYHVVTKVSASAFFCQLPYIGSGAGSKEIEALHIIKYS